LANSSGRSNGSGTDDPDDTPATFGDAAVSELGLPRELVGALREISRVRRLLVALDFDGTLAPEVDDPEQARAIPEARSAVLSLLDLPGTRVALVSGRSLRSLELVSDLPDTALLVGSHGIEIRLDHPGDAVSLDTRELRQVDVLNEVLGEVADSFDQVWLEPKPAGFALHTRLATDHNSRVAHLVAVSEATAEVDNVKVRHGKNVLEFSVRSTTKGDAIEHLRSYTNADAVFYAGDDVTDEDAFAALTPDDFGLKSGTGETAAAHRVAGPTQVAQVLALLAEFRDGSAHEQ
jgi:trehalose 6-phosphate phosphatase